MKKVIKTMIILAVLLSMAMDTFALSLLRPYGFTLPLEEFASDPSDFSNDIYAVLIGHTLSFSNGMLNITSNQTDNLSTFNFGGKNGVGSTLAVAPTGGKQVSRFTFSLTKSATFDNRYGTAGENLDCNAFVLVGGNWVSFRMKGTAFNDNNYTVTLNWGGPDSDGETALNLTYGQMYTLIFEMNVIEAKASMRLEDANGTLLGAKYATTGVAAARNGFRFRVRDDFDIKVSEVSSYREAYLVKDLTVTQNGDNIDVSVNMASDCTIRENLYGAALTAPILLVGQFDSEDRLLSYTITEPTLSARDASSTEVVYSPITKSIEKHRDFHHAKACVWSDMEDMLSYCGMAQ